MPGHNIQRAATLNDAELALRTELVADVQALAGDIGERNMNRYPQLLAAADFIEGSLGRAGLTARRDTYELRGRACHNLEVEISGTRPEIFVIGAHYDSVFGSPGANDNASGVAALLALARRFARKPAEKTLRFIAFVNLVRLPHTVFALPFALIGVVLASYRYRLRLADIGFRVPPALEPVRERVLAIVEQLEEFQRSAAQELGIDREGVPFHVKKEVTSAMRRVAPMGLSTDIIWTANVRTLRHVIEMRTAPGAEEELRTVFDRIARMMQVEAPGLFQDFTQDEEGSWVPEHHKV